MGWTADDMPDLSGKRAIVTGANVGLGAAAARALAGRGAAVVLAVRTPKRAEEVAAQIRGLGGTAEIEALDLSSFDSIRAFAERIEGPIDLLLNNAGIMAPPAHTTTADGHELQFGTNHLGHFALTGLLLPHLLAADHARVTTVASIAHHRGDASVLEGNPPQGYGTQRSYGQSKLANILFADELQRRSAAAGARLTSNAAHPGVSNTTLFTRREGMGSNWLVRTFAPLAMGLAFPGPERAADALLFALTVGQPGSYTGPTGPAEARGPIGPAKRSPSAQDPELARRLWERSEELTGVAFDFLRR